MKYWITTHWPTPPGLEGSRHVYVKDRHKTVPKVGDLILIYEAEDVHVNNKRVRRGARIHLGRREEFEIPKGRGAIIMAVKVNGPRRPQVDSDAVLDFGNLREWAVIPCGNARDLEELSKSDAMELLGKPRTTSPRFWSLWRVPEQYVPALLGRLGIKE